MLLQGERHDLLRNDVIRLRGRHDRLYISIRPEVQKRSGVEKGRAIGGQEEAIACSSGTPPGPTESLEERGNSSRGVDLNHTIEIAHIETEFEGARRDDHRVACGTEGRPPPAPVPRR